VEGAAAEVEVVAGAEATRRKENGIASSTRIMTIIAQTIAQTRKIFEAILEEERKEKERVGTVNHSAPAWQNPNFWRTSFANPFQPPQFQLPVPTNTPLPPWQSQTFQAQNIERRPIEKHPIAPPPPPSRAQQLRQCQRS
jgi:hypothetical protein